MKHRLRRGVLAAGLALLAWTPVLAQEPDTWEAERLQASRPELERLLERYEAAGESRAYSDGLRTQARLQAARIRSRLEGGDFTAGDRILLVVEGLEQLSDTFAVRTGGTLSLPVVGEVSLRGVLRSEIESHLTERIAAVVLDPVVRARPLVRLAVLGSVARPGYYAVAADAHLSEALMLAGGPAPDAELDRMRIERGQVQVRSSEEVQEAIALGLTVDQLGLRAGDRLTVPTRGTWNAAELGRTALFSIPGILLALLTRL